MQIIKEKLEIEDTLKKKIKNILMKWYDKSRQVKKDQSTFSMLKYNKGVDNIWEDLVEQKM